MVLLLCLNSFLIYGRKLPFNRETSATACLLLDTPEFAEENYMGCMIPEENLKWMRKCSYRESAI